MNPGRELDALVAEKVMGWEAVHEHDFRDGGKQWLGTRSDGAKMVPLPHYSTSIAAAWEVVAHLRSLASYVRWELRGDRHDYNCYFCLGRGVEWVEDIDTAPHAICLAALKAVGALSDTP